MGGLFLTASSHIQSIPVFDMSLESIPSWPFPLITLLITLGLPVPVYLPFGPPLHIARLIVLLQLELCHRPTHKILAVPRCCQIKSKLYTLVFCTLILPYLRASWFPLTLPSKSLPIIEGLCPFVYLLHEDFLDSLKLFAFFCLPMWISDAQQFGRNRACMPVGEGWRGDEMV